VHGTVLLDGKPLAEAMVVLHPSAPQSGSQQRPIGYSDQSGHFALTTWRSSDGAPTGDYTITVELRAPRKVGEEMIRDGRNLLPDRYAHASSSPLRCKVEEKSNELAPIRVASR
jgi:hypothetical protein